DVTVNFTTSNSSAVAPGDYTATSGTLTFVPGTTVQTITVPVVGDAAVEGNESFTVILSGAVNATIADKQGSGMIYDDDGARQVVINDASVVECSPGTTTGLIFSLPTRRSAVVDVTVNFTTSSSSA